MTARYLHPGAGTCGRPRAVHTPEEAERQKRRHQDRHNERRRRSRAGLTDRSLAGRRPDLTPAEVAERVAVVRAAKLECMRRNGYLHLSAADLDAIGMTEGRRR